MKVTKKELVEALYCLSADLVTYLDNDDRCKDCPVNKDDCEESDIVACHIMIANQYIGNGIESLKEKEKIN